MTKARDIADFKFEDIVDTGTEGTKVASGTTAQRGSTAGQFRFNSTTGKFEGRNNSNFISLEASPVVNSVNSTNITQSQLDAGFDLVITGQNFTTGDTVKFIADDNSEYISPTVTIDSTTQITARVNTNLDSTKEPYKVKVTSSGGLAGELGNAFNIDASPIWSTASGTLATIQDDATGTHATVSATDPEGDTVTYSETGGTVLSTQNLTLNSSTGAITGDPADVFNSTTHNFTLRATSGTNNTDRAFNIIVTPRPIDIEYLVIAGGGGGGSNTGNYENGGGGGAGGFLTATGFSFSIGQNYTVTVGEGGSAYNSGQNSVFATITAFGGGGGGGSSPTTAKNGGSGGGGTAWGSNGQFGRGTYPGSPAGGIYDAPRQGYDGGVPTISVAQTGGGGGGGGAGGAGVNGNGSDGGSGGAGKASSITGSSVTYAGGGGAGGGNSAGSGGSGGGGVGNTGGNGGNGQANTGSGGGGVRNGTGGSGGSGIVILKYPSTRTLTIGSSLTSTTVDLGNGYKYTKFTAGSDTIYI